MKLFFQNILILKRAFGSCSKKNIFLLMMSLNGDPLAFTNFRQIWSYFECYCDVTCNVTKKTPEDVSNSNVLGVNRWRYM